MLLLRKKSQTTHLQKQSIHNTVWLKSASTAECEGSDEKTHFTLRETNKPFTSCSVTININIY